MKVSLRNATLAVPGNPAEPAADQSQAFRRGQGTYVASTSVNGTERRALADAAAARAFRDAYRNGIGADELIEAIRRAATDAESVHTSENQ